LALSSSTVFEVRNGGSATNGGGFVTGASGSDLSLQDAAQYAVTDAVTAGTTTITSATANFGTDVVGNILYIQGGTGSIVAGWYQIISRTNSTTIVVDRSTGLSVGTGATLNIGGAFAGPATAIALMTVPGIQTWIRYHATPYSLGTGITFPSVGGSGFTWINKVEGYTSTRGDRSTKPIIRGTAAITMFTMSVNGNGNWLINLDIDGNSTANNGVLASNTTYGGVSECLIRRMLNTGYSAALANSTLERSEVTGCGGATDGAAVYMSSMVNVIAGNYIHDNTTKGIRLNSNSAGGVVVDNIIESNTGATSDGIDLESYFTILTGNTVYNNGRDGIRFERNYSSIQGLVFNNIVTSNAGYGFNMVSAPGSSQAIPNGTFNFFYNNTSGPRNNYPVGASDVTLTGDPFTSAAAGDFSLNNTAGAGAAVRATGFPGTMPGGLTVGYRDGGAAQHQDSASSGGGGNLLGNGTLVSS
jgi:hypothetical protein